jgi:hypothetical protein
MADWIAGLTHADITTQTLTWAKHAVLDWLGVTIAGAHEPLSDMLIADALSEGAAGSAHLMRRPERTIPSQAALINGSASHALDYDDVHLALVGEDTAALDTYLEAAMDLHTLLACASCSYRDVRLTEADHTGCDPGLSPRQAT